MYGYFVINNYNVANLNIINIHYEYSPSCNILREKKKTCIINNILHDYRQHRANSSSSYDGHRSSYSVAADSRVQKTKWMSGQFL